MNVILFDFDLTGADSIEHLIEAGLVKRVVCDTFERFERACISLLPQIQPDDLLVFDTYSSAVDKTRINAKLGNDPTMSLWEKRSLYTGGDKNYQTVYSYATDAMMLRIQNMAALHNSAVKIVILAHEDQERDPLTMMIKRGPQANPAAVKTLLRCSTDVMRLAVQQEDELDDEGRVKIAKDSRILYMKNTDEHIAKVHVRRDIGEKLPAGILNPTMAKIRKVLKKNPSILTIYGPTGAGKTTLATSDAQDQYDAMNAPQTEEPKPTTKKTKKEEAA